MTVPLILKTVGGFFEPATKLLDEIITSKDEKQQNLNRLLELKKDMMNIQSQVVNKVIEYQTKIVMARSSSLTAELTGNRLQKSWRPILMLAFGFIIINQYFLGPLLGLKTIEILPDRFWYLLEIGIGSYIAGRSLEKIVPTASAALTHGKRLAKLEYGEKILKHKSAAIQPSPQNTEYITKRELRRLKRKQSGEERRLKRLED